MSDPSVEIEPPDNNWRSDNRQTLQTSLSGCISRKDQSRNKHKSKKRRRRRSSSTSSSSRSASSDSCKRSRNSKRSKLSHKKKRRRYTSSSSSSSLSDNQSHDYGRYKRNRHSPQAAQNPSMLQPVEITNVQTVPQTEQTLQRSTKNSGSDSEIENWSFDRAIKFSGFCLRRCPRPTKDHAPAKPLSGIKHLMESHKTPLLLLPQSKV